MTLSAVSVHGGRGGRDDVSGDKKGGRPEQAGRVPGLGTRRVALGLFCPTVPTGVPSLPRSPHSWLPTMLLQDIVG